MIGGDDAGTTEFRVPETLQTQGNASKVIPICGRLQFSLARFDSDRGNTRWLGSLIDHLTCSDPPTDLHYHISSMASAWRLLAGRESLLTEKLGSSCAHRATHTLKFSGSSTLEFLRVHAQRNCPSLQSPASLLPPPVFKRLVEDMKVYMSARIGDQHLVLHRYRVPPALISTKAEANICLRKYLQRKLSAAQRFNG